MKSARLFAVLLAVACARPAAAFDLDNLTLRGDLDRVNRRLAGRLLDFTNNHGSDNRLWSAALGERRDAYVYLPPGYDPCLAYPVILYLHGYTQDETHFLHNLVVPFDRAMAGGQLPPAVVVVPDGSLRRRPTFQNSASFFINSDAGRFEDYLLCDVWPWVNRTFKLRPEPEAHALVGGSMGGAQAFALAMRHQELFRVSVGILPPLNLMWEDCRGRYLGNFTPCCQGYRSDFRPNEVVGRFYGVIMVRFKMLIDPLYGRGPDVLARIATTNPYDVLATCDVRDGQVAMYVGYAGRDEFNLDAQAESFLFRARQRGICVASQVVPSGHHDTATALKLFPAAADWLAPRLAPYCPK